MQLFVIVFEDALLAYPWVWTNEKKVALVGTGEDAPRFRSARGQNTAVQINEEFSCPLNSPQVESVTGQCNVS